ncbi:MAG: asparaginase [Oscillospiraceae bacterium]|jgi:L-asparaginase|nr:asparaginase [Oscillospiraceae bacterium]
MHSRIVFLTTGGTIGSHLTENGLTPAHDAESILDYLRDTNAECEFVHETLLNLDSSNIQPEHWQLIARRVYELLPSCDGIIITHGTDTLAYTACALSFMLRGLKKSVVLTGSQLPISSPLSDAVVNLHTAVEAIRHNIVGVSVSFDRKLIAGTRAVKVSTMGFNAFESLNTGYLARMYSDGLRVFDRPADYSAGETALFDKLSTDVFILKLLPGTRPEIFTTLLDMGYRGLVIEAFGAGGLHYIDRDLLSALRQVIKAGLSVVVCSQCLYERCDLSIYEVGRRLLAEGVISGRDMTTEAVSVKLMWALGQTDNAEKVAALFDMDIAGEVSSGEKTN